MTANNIQNPEEHVFKVLKADIFFTKKNQPQTVCCVPTIKTHSVSYVLTKDISCNIV